MVSPQSDSQSEAFRGATEEDWVSDEDLARMLAAGDLRDVSADPYRTPDVVHESGWDEGRE